MPPAELEPTIPASDRPQTLTLDRSATGIAVCRCKSHKVTKRMCIRAFLISALDGTECLGSRTDRFHPRDGATGLVGPTEGLDIL
jgi:hypothetical protein